MRRKIGKYLILAGVLLSTLMFLGQTECAGLPILPTSLIIVILGFILALL